MYMIDNSFPLLRIYVDHWEDYESIGDQAMLLNALRRLELYLGSCQFVGPLSPNNKGKFQYPNLVTVVPPHWEIQRDAGWLRSLYARLARRLPSRLVPKFKPTVFLDFAIFIFSVKFFLYTLGFHSIFGEAFRSTLEELKTCDVFFTVGDCSLSDYWLEGVALKSWLIQFVKRYVSVSMLSSQGMGPLTAPWARKRLVQSLSTLDLLSFRDFSNSKALVEAGGLHGVPYKIVMDEAFSLPAASHAAVWKVLQASGISQAEPFIIVNFRTTDFTQSTTSLLDKIADLLDRVTAATHKKVVFIPMSSGENYGRDYQAGMSLKGRMKHGDSLVVLQPPADVYLAKGIIGAAAYSIGISYHLHVFSLSQGHPTLIVYTGDYYRTKSNGLISFYAPPNRAIDFSEASAEQVLNDVLAIEKDYASACAGVMEVNKGIAEKNDWTIQTLKRLLEQKGLLPGWRVS